MINFQKIYKNNSNPENHYQMIVIKINLNND